ncbi:MAG: hydroxyacid dehydrogenase [Victivallaceae bacterium]|nr:hydroxyacid dehydrogenase [Victivallaceae bacterium]
MEIESIFLCDDPTVVRNAYAPEVESALAAEAGLRPCVVTGAMLDQAGRTFDDVSAVFTAWGVPRLTAARLDKLPSLEIIFYAGGSVRHFIGDLPKNVRVVAAAEANAKPVAEYVASVVLLGGKGFFRNSSDMRANAREPFRGPGGNGLRVALLGFGHVARHVRGLLAMSDAVVSVYDPYLDEEEAARLGVRKVSLEEAFSSNDVVSDNLPLLPETEGLISSRLLETMPRNGLFINTSRGATVDERGLISVLEKRRDILAVLDVSCPEPAAADSPLRRLPNVILTGHIAGSLGNEMRRMGDLLLEEFRRWKNSVPLRHEVDRGRTGRMA